MAQLTEEDIKELEQLTEDYKTSLQKVRRASGELSVRHPVFRHQKITVPLPALPVETAELNASLNQAQGNLVAKLAQLSAKAKG